MKPDKHSTSLGICWTGFALLIIGVVTVQWDFALAGFVMFICAGAYYLSITE